MTGGNRPGCRSPGEGPDSTAWARALRSRLRHEPLWEFALALYAREGVEAACLSLQEEAGVDVCELLWRAWLHHHGARLAGEPPELAGFYRWQAEITRPLRTLRRQLKAHAREDTGIAAVRRSIQHAELAAEREALARLQRLAESTLTLSPLPEPPPGLATTLAARWQVQKKSQLMALKRLESQLDPP
ncbi:TIGR02444 family protein [Halomonas sp. NO4]|uniref:TIGR02444 family protein n=1 Tax=Halomonas sp. NO4 TaxID=2484813 RepID=UPI0013CF6A7E|nr:TIGR02444 family protein [Halomonas sp. NO4]